jgi:ankyrin repeat protein
MEVTMKKLILLLLLLNSVNVAFTSETEHNTVSLFEAVFNGDIKKATELLSRGNLNINAKDNNGFPVLMNAMISAPKLVKLLIEFGADVNVQDIHQWTPLIHAVASESPELVQLLIKSNANVNAKNKNGNTALMFAVTRKSPELVQLLINNEADINAKNNLGEAALDLAFDKLQDLPVDNNIKEIINLILTKYYQQYHEEIHKVKKEIYESAIMPLDLSNIIGDYALDFIDYLKMRLGKELPENYIEFINNNFLARITKSELPVTRNNER